MIENPEHLAKLEDMIKELTFIGIMEAYKLNLEIKQAPGTTTWMAFSVPINMACISEFMRIYSEDWLNTLYEIQIDRLNADGSVVRSGIMIPTSSDVEEVNYGNRRIKRSFVMVGVSNIHSADTIRIVLSTEVNLINQETLDNRLVLILGLKYDNQYMRLLKQEQINSTGISNKLQGFNVPQFRMFSNYPIAPAIPDPAWTHKKYKCLDCNSVIEVDYDVAEVAVLREFRDQYALEYTGIAFWGRNAHNRCPLLLQSTKSEYDQAILDGLIVEI